MSHEIDRRNLLRLGALGLAAPVLAASAAAAAATSLASPTRSDVLRHSPRTR